MNELKATPGPWKTNRDGYVYSVATGERVCSPHSTLPDNEKMSEHIKDLKANAHLIAAAPELYEALRGCAEALVYYGTMKPSGEFQKVIPRLGDALSEAKAALTKARGEA
jgi:hypothetical protein